MLVPVQYVALRGRDGGATAELGGDISGTLRASGGGGGGDKAYVLAPIAFDSRQDCVSSTELFGALGSSSPQAQAVCITGDITHCLKAEGFDASEDGTGRGQPIVTAAREIAGCITSNYGKQLDNSDTALGPNVAIHGMAVRRLTPRECARLQGFPDDYLSQVMVRGKPMADGPQYKALGNSWAVPNVRWIGERIARELEKCS